MTCTSQPPDAACANKPLICNQILELDNIKAAAGVKAAQACNINFEAEQKKKDDAKQAAKDKAAAMLHKRPRTRHRQPKMRRRNAKN